MQRHRELLSCSLLQARDPRLAGGARNLTASMEWEGQSEEGYLRKHIRLSVL